MEEWQKSFFEMLEVAANEVEQFFQEVSEEAIEVVEALFELSEQVTEQVQNTLFNELDQFLNQLVGSGFDDDLETEQLETEQVEMVEQPEHFMGYVQPTPQKYAACMGCNNYHGQIYGGNLVVCGMHPYGWDGESCPDWEAPEMFK